METIENTVNAIVNAYNAEISGGWWDDGEESVYDETMDIIVNGGAAFVYDELSQYLEDGEDMPLTRHALELLNVIVNAKES